MERVPRRAVEMVSYWNELHPEWGPIYVWFAWFRVGNDEAWLPSAVSWPMFLPDEEKQALEGDLRWVHRSAHDRGWTTDPPKSSRQRQSLLPHPDHPPF